jgi:hypothetical protein
MCEGFNTGRWGQRRSIKVEGDIAAAIQFVSGAAGMTVEDAGHVVVGAISVLPEVIIALLMISIAHVSATPLQPAPVAPSPAASELIPSHIPQLSPSPVRTAPVSYMSTSQKTKKKSPKRVRAGKLAWKTRVARQAAQVTGPKLVRG